jgi:response regulator NasT
MSTILYLGFWAESSAFYVIKTTMANDYRPTVLVVDDNAETMRLISTALAGAGYRVLESKSGLDGIATMLCFEGEIELAVIEINMPGISGLDVANQLGIDRPTTEVLYVSDLVESVAANSILLSDPRWVLFKPFTARELLAHVHDLVSRRAA